MPEVICRQSVLVLLLLAPMFTVPRLPGEPVPSGKRFAVWTPLELLLACRAFQVCWSSTKGRSMRLPAPLALMGAWKPPKLLIRAAVAVAVASKPWSANRRAKKVGTWPFSLVVRRTVTCTALQVFGRTAEAMVAPFSDGLAKYPTTTSLLTRFGFEPQTGLSTLYWPGTVPAKATPLVMSIGVPGVPW